MLAVFARVDPALRKSITFDNDTAFAQHALLRTMRAMTTWFCDAYASWQKGGVEKCQRSITTVRSAAYCGKLRARSSISDGRSLARSRRSNGLKLWPSQSVLFRHPTNANSIAWQHS